MARINGSGFKMKQSPTKGKLGDFFKNVFGKEAIQARRQTQRDKDPERTGEPQSRTQMEYEADQKYYGRGSYQFKPGMSKFQRDVKMNKEAGERQRKYNPESKKKLHEEVGKVATYVSSDAVKARRKARLNKKTKVDNVEKKPNVAPNLKDKIKVKTTNNLTLGNKNKDIKAPEVKDPRTLSLDAKSKYTTLGTRNNNSISFHAGRTAKNKKTGEYVGTKVSVKKLKTTDLSKTVGVKATVKNKATTPKKSKSGRKAGESQYQYNVRVATANRKLKKSIKTSQATYKPSDKKVDLTKKTGLGPRA